MRITVFTPRNLTTGFFRRVVLQWESKQSCWLLWSVKEFYTANEIGNGPQ